MKNAAPVAFLLLFLLAGFSLQCHKASVPLVEEKEEEEEKPVQVVEEAFAFPGAEGFGQNATGGRGGRVIYVTNLNDAGPGSFRAAVLAAGPRFVLFTVSGNISLKSRLDIKNGSITIAGQTAPGDGICIKDYPVTISADNVIIRFMRFRMGDEAGQEGDPLGGRFHKNIIIDHCSVSWSTDECLSFYGNENTTLQWSFVTESLRNSVHSKGAHGYGGIWGGRRSSFHHNLLANHDSRNPRLGETGGDAFALTDLVDLRNNVIYNWGNNSCYGGEAMNVNIINCYYKPGPATKKKERIIAIDKNLEEGTDVYNIWGKFYIAGNIMEGSSRTTTDNWTYGVYEQSHSKYGVLSAADKAAMKMDQEHPTAENVSTHTAELAYQKVLELGGASLVRDAIDLRIVAHVQNGTYASDGSEGSTAGIIDSQNDVDGWPDLTGAAAPLDSSGDGMPDDWKRKQKLNPEQSEANGNDLSSAYDNVEVYINSLVKEIVSKQK